MALIKLRCIPCHLTLPFVSLLKWQSTVYLRHRFFAPLQQPFFVMQYSRRGDLGNVYPTCLQVHQQFQSWEMPWTCPENFCMSNSLSGVCPPVDFVLPLTLFADVWFQQPKSTEMFSHLLFSIKSSLCLTRHRLWRKLLTGEARLHPIAPNPSCRTLWCRVQPILG